MLKEWPLVAFTILGQTAVGILVAAGLPWILIGRALEGPGQVAFMSTLLALVLALLAVASLLSFFHLHHPLRAYRALANLRTSWLSREILFELATIALVGLEIVLMRTTAAPLWILKGVMAAACLSGLFFILSMIKLYKLATVPAWNLSHVAFLFSMTSVVLGLVMASLLWRIFVGHDSDLVHKMLFLVGAALAFELVGVLVLDPRHRGEAISPSPSLRPPAVSIRPLAYGRLIALTAGLVILGLILFRRWPESEPPVLWEPPLIDLGPLGLQVAALVVLAAAEVMGRFLFYGLVPRPGEPAE